MIGTWSGSIIYEWVQETNDYGLVTYPNGQIYSGAPIPLSPDYSNLQNVWKTINPTGIAESAYTPSFTAPACPAASGGWAVNGDVPLPTLGASVVSAAAANEVILPSSVASSSATQSTAATTSATTSGTFAIYQVHEELKARVEEDSVVVTSSNDFTSGSFMTLPSSSSTLTMASAKISGRTSIATTSTDFPLSGPSSLEAQSKTSLQA